jgi:site-specific recombinase XerD
MRGLWSLLDGFCPLPVLAVFFLKRSLVAYPFLLKNEQKRANFDILLCDMERTLQELVRQFLEYTEIEKGRSVKTVENYARYLERFLSYTKISKPKDITDDVVREYRLWLNRQSSKPVARSKALAAGRVIGNTKFSDTLKKKTQNYYLIALRSFLKYLARRGITTLSAERIELAKVGERSLDLITSTELSRLLSAPVGEDIGALRDRAILELFFSTGLRVSELASLPRDVDLTRDELAVRGKGDKVRVVFLSKTAKTAILAYLAKRVDIDDALFVGVGIKAINESAKGAHARSQRLTPRSIERLVRKYATIAGISKKVTPHVIRHSFATDLLQNGADMRSVQALLGHANIATTQVYTHVTDKHLREVHEKFHNRPQ